ncbi:MAG: hypothetical protein AAF485_08405 [Chloroflexota bacterium]
MTVLINRFRLVVAASFIALALTILTAATPLISGLAEWVPGSPSEVLAGESMGTGG